MCEMQRFQYFALIARRRRRKCSRLGFLGRTINFVPLLIREFAFFREKKVRGIFFLFRGRRKADSGKVFDLRNQQQQEEVQTKLGNSHFFYFLKTPCTEEEKNRLSFPGTCLLELSI